MAGSLFFEHGNSYFNSADAIVRELIFQLACRLPEYRSLLLYRLNSLSNAQSLNTQELFEQLLAYPLRSGVKGDYETLCIVIDGLDECDEESRQTAARLLSEERFPAWLRVAVLSRPENTVTANLKPDLELCLDEDEAANRADIRAYYTLRLAESWRGRPIRNACWTSWPGGRTACSCTPISSAT